jgi:hypothetical protein
VLHPQPLPIPLSQLRVQIGRPLAHLELGERRAGNAAEGAARPRRGRRVAVVVRGAEALELEGAAGVVRVAGASGQLGEMWGLEDLVGVELGLEGLEGG